MIRLSVAILAAVTPHDPPTRSRRHRPPRPRRVIHPRRVINDTAATANARAAGGNWAAWENECREDA